MCLCECNCVCVCARAQRKQILPILVASFGAPLKRANNGRRFGAANKGKGANDYGRTSGPSVWWAKLARSESSQSYSSQLQSSSSAAAAASLVCALLAAAREDNIILSRGALVACESVRRSRTVRAARKALGSARGRSRLARARRATRVQWRKLHTALCALRAATLYSAVLCVRSLGHTSALLLCSRASHETTVAMQSGGGDDDDGVERSLGVAFGTVAGAGAAAAAPMRAAPLPPPPLLLLSTRSMGFVATLKTTHGRRSANGRTNSSCGACAAVHTPRAHNKEALALTGGGGGRRRRDSDCRSGAAAVRTLALCGARYNY